jgi:glycosyltransferase involved in cell wall biosynthesis
VISVSHFLGAAINQTLLQKQFEIIPNVVDTSLFFPIEQKPARFTFLHVSNMVPLKNVAGILVAFRQFLDKTGSEAQLILVGNKDDEHQQVAQQIGLSDHSVFFKGEIRYESVAKEMQQAHAFVLNSDIENSPCVIGEALCCGLPVIATKVGGIPELVSPENGILVPPNDNIALAAAFLQMISDYNRFHRRDIARSAQNKFSMALIGEKIHRLYR